MTRRKRTSNIRATVTSPESIATNAEASFQITEEDLELLSRYRTQIVHGSSLRIESSAIWQGKPYADAARVREILERVIPDESPI